MYLPPLQSSLLVPAAAKAARPADYKQRTHFSYNNSSAPYNNTDSPDRQNNNVYHSHNTHHVVRHSNVYSGDNIFE